MGPSHPRPAGGNTGGAAAKPAFDALKPGGTTRAVGAAAVGAGLAVGAATLVAPTWVGVALAAGAAFVGATVGRLMTALWMA